MSVAIVAAAAVLYGGGVWMLLSRSLLRVILGITLLGHGSVLLLLVAGGPPGAPAFTEEVAGGESVTDPLPQALGLTAIVITFTLVAFLLALTWRSRAVLGGDRILLDREDRRIAELETEGGA